MSKVKIKNVNRRGLLRLAAGLGAAGAVADVAQAQAPANPAPKTAVKPVKPAKPAAPKIKFNNSFDFTNAEWNRDAYCRLQGDLDLTKTRYGWLGGPVMAVVPNEKVKPLFWMEGFSACRLVPYENRINDTTVETGYRKLLREVVVYRQWTPKGPGAILETWDNPYTGETVRVVPIENDPFNYNITQFYPDPPSFGGLNTEKPPKMPLILPWSVKGDMLHLTTDIHLYYPNALQPDKWPRESAGAMVQVTELYRYYMSVKDMKNPNLTQVPCSGCWSRVTPWLPWMLMGKAAGHMLYMVDFTGADEPAHLSQELRAWLDSTTERSRFLTPPESDYGPSLSSLENYARTQKPAPPK
jgi:hypothetical protein